MTTDISNVVDSYILIKYRLWYIV